MPADTCVPEGPWNASIQPPLLIAGNLTFPQCLSVSTTSAAHSSGLEHSEAPASAQVASEPLRSQAASGLSASSSEGRTDPQLGNSEKEELGSLRPNVPLNSHKLDAP